MSELKPCPFCGGTDLRLAWVDGYDSVGCMSCHGTLESDSGSSRDAWNRRAPNPVIAEVVNEMWQKTRGDGGRLLDVNGNFVEEWASRLEEENGST